MSQSDGLWEPSCPRRMKYQRITIALANWSPPERVVGRGALILGGGLQEGSVRLNANHIGNFFNIGCDGMLRPLGQQNGLRIRLF